MYTGGGNLSDSSEFLCLAGMAKDVRARHAVSGGVFCMFAAAVWIPVFKLMYLSAMYQYF